MKLTHRSSCCGARCRYSYDNSKTYICTKCNKVCSRSLGLSNYLLRALKKDIAKALNEAVFNETPFAKHLTNKKQ